MCIAKKDPSPEKGDTNRRPRPAPGAHALADVMPPPFAGLGRMGFSVRPVTPGLTPPGSMISPPSGALNILVSINRNRMEAMPVQDQLSTAPGSPSQNRENPSRIVQARS